MEYKNDSIIKLSDQAERENEMERLKRKFKFNNSFNMQNKISKFKNNVISNSNNSSNTKIEKNNNIFRIKNEKSNQNHTINKIENPYEIKSAIKVNNNNKSKLEYLNKGNLSNKESKNAPTSHKQQESNYNCNEDFIIYPNKHKKSNSTVPIKINNIVNIVNNNYNNIYAPNDMIPLPSESSNSSKRILDAFSYGTINTKNSKISVKNDTDTERKSLNNQNLIEMNQISINPNFKNALNDFSARSEQSYIFQENLNSYLKNIPMINNSNSEIPSEEDRVNYDRFCYNEKIKVISNKYSKKDSSFSDKINGEDDIVQASEREKISFQIPIHIDNKKGNFDFRQNSIFVKNPICNLSNRYINDESKHLHSLRKNTNVKFIKKIREDREKKANLDLDKFWNLSHNSLFNILSFIFDQYDDLLKANKLLSNKILLCLNYKFEHLIINFKEKFGDYLELQEFYFKQTNFIKIKQKFTVIDLVIKSKIKTKEINCCTEISLTFNCDLREYIQTWKFDLKKKSDIGFWFASESEEYNKNIIRLCYYQPIISFCKDDFVEIRINIFSNSGIIQPDSAQWLDLIVQKTPEHSFLEYEKSLVKSNVKFDRIRFCELENIIHVWKNEKSLTKKNNIEEFKKCFQNNFKILDVNYDVCKFYIYKVKMQANYKGIVKKNKFTNVEIEIKPYNENVTNETQCLGLLNTNHLTKRVELRVYSYVIFYFTDLYL